MTTGPGESLTEVQVLVVGDVDQESSLAASLQNGESAITTRSCDDPERALGILSNDDWDAVISGYDLSGTDGLAFLRSVRQRHPDLPFILCPADGSETLASEAVTAGVTEYLPKRVLAQGDAILADRLEAAVEQAHRRREHRETHALFRSLTKNAPFAVVSIDADSVIRYANDGIRDILGYEPEDVIGDSLTRLMPDRFTSAHRAGVEQYIETGTPTLDWSWVDLPGRHAEGHEVPLGITFGEVVEDDQHLFTAIIRDITDQKRVEAERELLTETIRDASEADSFVDGLQAVIEEFCHTFELAYGEAWIPSPGEDHLVRTEAAHATAEEYEPFKSTSGDTTFGSGEGLPGRAWARESIVWMENVSSLTEAVFPRVEAAKDAGLKAAFGLPIFAGDHLVAVLAFYLTEEQPRDDQLVGTASTIASELGGLFERKQAIDALQEREQQLQQQRDELEQLDRLNGIIRKILVATVEADSRNEVETLVCERLLEDEVFQSAWIGDIDISSERLHSQAATGISRDATEGGPYSLAELPSDHPIVRAVRTGDVQVDHQDPQATADEDEQDIWALQRRDTGARSGAAIPLVDEEWLMGVLTVFTDHPDEFGPRERAVLGELGRVIGKTIRTTEQREALVSPKVIELTFRSKLLSERFADVVGSDGPVEIAVEGVVPDGDMRHQFLRADGISADAFTDILESFETVVEVSTFDDADDHCRVKASTEDRPLAEIFADVGGRLRWTRYEDGEVSILAQVPSATDTRQLLDALKEVYPRIDVLSQVYIERTPESLADFRAAVREQLTDRQQTAVELAYHSGFYEWPREATGEEVAARMDISAATFTQHLREGNRKLLEIYLNDSSEEDEADA